MIKNSAIIHNLEVSSEPRENYIKMLAKLCYRDANSDQISCLFAKAPRAANDNSRNNNCRHAQK